MKLKLKPLIYSILAMAAVFLAIMVFVSGMARLTWFLSEAGESEFSELQAIEPPDRDPSGDIAFHKVMEVTEVNIESYQQAPMLDEQTESGQLPPVEERVPENPLVIVPPEQLGPYGGTWTRLATGPSDVGVMPARIAYDGLVRWDSMGREVLPNLAWKWEVSEDAKVYTFYLRKGVRWSDGAPFTVDDILFWYEDIVGNPDLSPVPPREFVRGGELAELERVDDYTFRFRFKEPYGIFLKIMASGHSIHMLEYPAHYMSQFHINYTPEEQLKSEARKIGFDLWHQYFSDRQDWRNPEHPRLWAWVIKDPPPERPSVFVRNPYYWKVDSEGNQLPYIDRLTFDIFDVETINLKGINGEMGMQGRHLSFENYPLFMQNQEKGNYRVLHWKNAGGGVLAVALNLNHKDPVMREVIGDRRFRIALSHAIDREELIELGSFGIGTPRQMAPPESSPFYSEEYAKAYVEHDPDRANALLDEMGLSKRDSKGYRLRPDGKNMKIYIETPSEFINTQFQELIAEYWRKVGVNTEVKLEARQLFYTRKAALLHDAGVWAAADEQIPVLDARWFIPFSTESIWAIGFARWFTSGGQSGQEPTPEIRDCIEIYRRIEATADEDEQIRLFHKILDYNRENLWVIGLFGDVPAPFLVNNRFRNVPEVAIFGWVFRTPGNTAPECYAIE